MTTRREVVTRFRRELRYYRALLRDPRTPRAARWFIGAGVGYLLMPFDFVPDFIPFLGQIDDLIVVPLLIGLGMLLIPPSVKRDVRNQPWVSGRTSVVSSAPVLCETKRDDSLAPERAKMGRPPVGASRPTRSERPKVMR
jgi:uncharacterized membrane protein YkvA (DUF1232 family)